MQKVLASLPASQRRSFEAIVKSYGSASIPIDIWVDGDGRIVRMVTATNLDVNGQSVQSDVQVDYFDFGVPVDVTAPPAGQVADLGGLGNTLGAS
jgi:hypothetical protein